MWLDVGQIMRNAAFRPSDSVCCPVIRLAQRVFKTFTLIGLAQSASVWDTARFRVISCR